MAVPAAALAGFRLWRSCVTMGQVEETVARYLGSERTREAFAAWSHRATWPMIPTSRPTSAF